ncbi:MAG: pyruvate dehydrogenase (acetyl-transferring), homodimeric type, partial [Betaproteobacteria bacterium]|nr:pyruvate dehydrogenase (acetyl-transferring), homodimeric type [Betaproteobacteria bacterium]
MSTLPEHVSQLMNTAADTDPQETAEWLEALQGVIRVEGPERAQFLVEALIDQTRRSGGSIPFSANTAYVNTIPAAREEHCPGNLEYEERLRSWMRWNAMAMVVRANRADGDLGGHISSFASLANMLGVGFNHFWKGHEHPKGQDLLFIQGHSSPGIYARAFLEGRISEDQLNNFRREVDGKGLSSYPHPKLMPEFWQFPTVSMGLGPIMAIYQARFLKYMHARGLAETSERKVWAFCGDGEMDEPESMGAIGLASREKLDNLVFVVNCNLQRLDGPVRGNGKIIQELESDFRGAGWNVIKVIWGGYWDPLLAVDHDGILKKIMMDTVDGEYQNYKANDGAYVRKHFFGKHPKALEMVAKMSDDDIWRLNRGGHDPHKIYSAFSAAVRHKGQPTVILVKTIKGFGMGKVAEGRNTAHQTKKLDDQSIREFRDRFG